MRATAAPPRISARPIQAVQRAPGVAGLGVAVVLATLIPYLCGYLLSPPHRVFLGALNNVGDLTQYLAAIRQGAAGAWRYTNQFSPDRATPVLMYFPYILIGKISLGFSGQVAFQVLRILSAAACLAALARFCRLFVGAQALRTAWLFTLMAGGLYWLVLLLSALGVHLVDPVRLTAPEFTPLITLLVSPHESLGLAAELLGFLLFLRGMGAPDGVWTAMRPDFAETQRPVRGHLLGAAGAFLVLALSYPFLLPTTGLVLLATVVVNALGVQHTRPLTATRKRRLRMGDVLITDLQRLILVFLPAGLLGAYYWRIFDHDPLWSQSRMATISAPDPVVLLFAFGPLVAGAWGGTRRLRRWRIRGDTVPFAWAGFPVIWSLVNACMLLLPIWQQGRQALGLSIPLALLTFLALAGVPSGERRSAVTLPALPAALLAFSSSLLLALYTAITAGAINGNYYAPTEVTQAVHWLGRQAGSADVILSSAGFGNLLPASCACHVVIGQNFETFDWPARAAEVHAFYAAPTRAVATAVLRTLVAREHVTFYVVSPYERVLGHTDLKDLPGFQLAFHDQTTSVYESAARRDAG
jgi:hypothetical protein